LCDDSFDLSIASKNLLLELREQLVVGPSGVVVVSGQFAFQLL
jgi:hypothetical protein